MTLSDDRSQPMGQRWVVTAGGCLVVLLTACSSGAGEPSVIATYAGGGSTSRVTPEGSPTLTPSPVEATSRTPGPAARTQSFTIRRGKLPARLTGDSAAAAEAWLVYWEYLAVADSIPALDPATSGSVMTGVAASKASAYVAKLKRTKTHVIGTVGVDLARASVRGSTATLCGRLTMKAFEFDEQGKPVESTVPTFLFFRGTALKAGPKWRISDYVNLAKPC
jgi:hypothetical protein